MSLVSKLNAITISSRRSWTEIQPLFEKERERWLPSCVVYFQTTKKEQKNKIEMPWSSDLRRIHDHETVKGISFKKWLDSYGWRHSILLATYSCCQLCTIRDNALRRKVHRIIEGMKDLITRIDVAISNILSCT